MKIFTSLILAMAILTGCTSTDSSNNIGVAASSSDPSAAILNPEQIRTQIIGNTLVGRNNNFPSVGPIDFWVYYSADGTAKDRLKFVRGGKVDRGFGVWRIIEGEQGIFCTKFAKRRKGAEVCSKLYVTGDQFRTDPTDHKQEGVSGKVVPGSQLQ